MSERLELEDMQGIIASAYLHLGSAAYLMFRIDAHGASAAKRWLGTLSHSITSAASKHDTRSINVALTHGGLERLGVEPHVLATFSVPFIDGMTSPRRKQILGDTDVTFLWGHHAAPVHVLLMVFAQDDAQLALIVDGLVKDANAAGLSDAGQLPGRTYDDRCEHFGFVDGISQPVLAGLRKPGKAVPERDVVENGEFVLGYKNEYRYVAEAPQLGLAKNLGRNGTYLVFRETSQDVPGFWAALDRLAAGDPVERDLLAAKMVGRWKSGAPLVRSPLADDRALATAGNGHGRKRPHPSNDFGYKDDPGGLRCPLGSHIRRANPRDGSLHSQASSLPARSERHRLLRRGRSYGERYDPQAQPIGERGLQFIALCSDLERQFEFVQQTWIGNPAFNDLDEVDPMLGGARNGSATYTLQAGPVRRRLHGMQSFVTLKGGAYFFVPSMKALRWFAGL